MLKKIFTFFVLLAFVIIGFGHNSMMAFAMKNNNMQKMGMMQMPCKHSDPLDCHNKCHSSDVKIKLPFSNSNFSKKIFKIKIFSFVNISENTTYFLENKKLIKNTSPPNFQRDIKNYSYANLVKIIKSNT